MESDVLKGYQVSPQQKQLWLLQTSDGSLAYRAQCAILIEGTLETEVLKAALQALVDRQEILRTNFCCLPGMTIPLQVVTDASVSWRTLDLRALNREAQEGEIDKLFQQEKSLGFEFGRGQLFHLYLVSLASDRHVLMLSLPALCADTWTLKNMVQAISRLYTGLLQGEPPLEEPLQYAQFSEWQNQLLEVDDENAKLGREYWRQQNLTSGPVILPFENRLSNRTVFDPGTFVLVLDRLRANIEAIVRQYQVTIPVFLSACWQTLLWRLTGLSNIVVNNHCNGREYDELKHALGLFARSLPVRCCFQEKFRLREICKQILEATRDACEWQDYFGCEQHVELAGNPRDFHVGFEFEERLPRHNSSSVSFSIYRQYSCIDRFKVKLSCIQTSDSLIAEFHYDSSVFEPEAVKRIAAHFQSLVTSGVRDADLTIGDLEIVSKADLNELLYKFNGPKISYPQDLCIHELFEKQVEIGPNDTAVVCEEDQLSYSELNQKTNQLAHYLQNRGIGREVIVAICVERSLEMVIGLLGILKAGAAYLPLDPSQPKHRFAFMLEDSGASMLLTQARLLNTIPTQCRDVVCLDTDWHEIARESCENTNSGATAENLVYLIYTSGSTGRSKGVAVEHRQLINYVNGLAEGIDLPSRASFATVSSFAADLGNTAIFPALCKGGCLHIVTQERLANPEALADYCRHHRIDCLKIVPSHLAALLSATNAADILPRQRLVLGGEASEWGLIEKLQSMAPECKIFNHYGPTETTIGVITYRVNRDQAHRGCATVPLGRALPNTELYVLDQRLRPVPMGVPGELYIGGAGLARGYWDRPDLTAQRFLPNGFGAELGMRIYKTGDLVCHLPDGNFQFLGRTDQQVKIRGFRIELGEIEAALNQHPGIRQVAVLAKEQVPGDSRLIAYIVPSRKPTPSVSELRNFLHLILADYLMPSAFVFLDRMPLTSNGKVNRQALPIPEQNRPPLENRFIAPRTYLEKKLAEIWCHLLGLKEVGVTDEFFELGGHSLLAVRLFVEIEKSLGRSLPVATIFTAPTIEQLATRLDVPLAAKREGCIVVLQQKGESPPLFCMSRGALFDFQRLVPYLGDDQPVYGMQYPGSDGRQEPLTSIEEIASEFIRHMRMVQPQGPYQLCGLCLGGLVAYEIAQQLIHQEQPVALLAMVDTFVPGFGRPRRKDRPPWDGNQSAKLVSWMHKVRETNRRAARCYRPQPYPGRLILFQPTKRKWEADPLNGWGPLITGGIETHLLDGSHGQMFREPVIRVLASDMRSCLLEASRRDRDLTFHNGIYASATANAGDNSQSS